MAKQTPPTESAPLPVPTRSYDIVGLQTQERMIIKFDGREYDLNSLNGDELAHLLQYPDQVPYLKKLDVSQASD